MPISSCSIFPLYDPGAAMAMEDASTNKRTAIFFMCVLAAVQNRGHLAQKIGGLPYFWGFLEPMSSQA